MTNEELVELVRNKYGKKFKVLDSEGNPTGEYEPLPLYYPEGKRTDLIWPKGYAELDFPIKYYNSGEVYDIADFMIHATPEHVSVREITEKKAYLDELNTYVYSIAFRIVSAGEIRNFKNEYENKKKESRKKDNWTAEDIAQLKAIIKLLRNSKYNKSVKIYDYFGDSKGHKSIPLWYSDTKKLCFPDKYYSQEKINEVVKFLEDNSNGKFKADVESDTYIAGLHTYGWTIRIHKDM